MSSSGMMDLTLTKTQSTPCTDTLLIPSGTIWRDSAYVCMPLGTLSLFCTGVYTASWQFDPCCKYQVRQRLQCGTTECSNSLGDYVIGIVGMDWKVCVEWHFTLLSRMGRLGRYKLSPFHSVVVYLFVTWYPV